MRSTAAKLTAGVWMLGSRASAFDIRSPATSDELATAALIGPDYYTVSTFLDGSPNSAGNFTDGPLSIGNGVILTTGAATGALPGQTTRLATGTGPFGLCGDPAGKDETVFFAQFLEFTPMGSSSQVKINFIFATDEYQGSPSRFRIFLDGENIAEDSNGNDITAQSPYFADGSVVKSPQSGTSYKASTPLLSYSTEKSQAPVLIHTLQVAICDSGDALKDSALLFNVERCTDCTPGLSPRLPSTAAESRSVTTTVPGFGATQSAVFDPVQASSIPIVVTGANRPRIDQYASAGCFSSAAGFPTFTEVGRNDRMTVERCVRLAQGRQFIGVYDTVCYAADALTDAQPTASQGCNVPCPGDQSQICGGRRTTTIRRRDVPADAVLTLYRLEWGNGNEGPEEGGPKKPGQGKPGQGKDEEEEEAGNEKPGKGKPGKGKPEDEEEEGEEASAEKPGKGRPGKGKPEDEEEEEAGAEKPGKGKPEDGEEHDHTKSHHGKDPKKTTTTETPVITSAPTKAKHHASHITTTIDYEIVDPVHKDRLIHTQFCTTLHYQECNACKEHHVPQVPVTTAKVECNRCGKHGEDHAIITGPLPAIATALPEYHKYAGHVADASAPEWSDGGAPHGHDKAESGSAAAGANGKPEGQEKSSAPGKQEEHAQSPNKQGGSEPNEHEGAQSPNKQGGAQASNQQGGAESPNKQGGAQSPGQQGGAQAGGSAATVNNPSGSPVKGPGGAQGTGPVVVSGGYGGFDTLCVSLLLVLGMTPMLL